VKLQVIAIVCGCACVAPISLVTSAAEPEYRWNLPKGFPEPYVPADNPMTAEKVELGRYLFYDTRMSVNGTQSCASCHKQELAFTDGRAVGVGATGQSHSRSAMSLVNIAYSAVLTWSNPNLRSLEEQALTPMFGDHPVELGLKQGDGFLPMLRGDAKYRQLFRAAFPRDADPFTIISAGSPYDRYHYGRDDNAVSEAAKQGEKLFFNQHLSCFRCHGGFNFSDATMSAANPERRVEFHNTGLYNAPGLLSYPQPNTGIYEYTKAPRDVGKFKTPTLRNVAVTAPYMHDGSIATLEAVLDHYAAGGRAHDNSNKDPLVGGFELSPQDKKNLIAFLETLTDDAVLHDARYGNPWAAGSH
jgi:cytochrome c peroxidase